MQTEPGEMKMSWPLLSLLDEDEHEWNGKAERAELIAKNSQTKKSLRKT